MSRRAPRVVLVGAVVALAATAGVVAATRVGSSLPGDPRRDPAFSADRAVACPEAGGFDLDDVRRTAACSGIWLGPARRSFVPQGLVVRGHEVVVSGYREGEPGARYCRILVAHRPTGDVEVLHSRLTFDRDGEQVICRHGGGLVQGPEGLWLAESTRLWLLDPQALRRGDDPVRRVWQLARPVRGSALARRGGRLAIVGWAAHRRSWVHWVRVRDLLADGAARVGPEPGVGVVVPVAARRVPSRVQGAVWRPGGLLLARSTTYCGELVSRGGDTRAFFPGAEGITLAGGRLWLVSESGAGVYRRQGGRPVLPTLMSVAWKELDRSPGCGWD